MKKLALFIAMIFLISCKEVATEELSGNDFYFEELQPINDSELSRFPRSFQGLFMNSDSAYVEINTNSILKKKLFRFKIHRSMLDSIMPEFRISGNKYISGVNNDIYYRKDINDSIVFSTAEIDTFFTFSDKQKVKRIGRHLILNEKDSIYWKISILSLEKNSLKLKYIYSDDDLKRLDSITKVKSEKIDSSSYIIRPSRREFKNMLKVKDLGHKQQFKKVSK